MMMKAYGITRNTQAEDARLLEEFTLPRPRPKPHDLLVQVRAVSVNPVDTKQRRYGDIPADGRRILGWDAAGTVIAADEAVNGFKPGDHVWYAGDIGRSGSYAEYQAVDHRIASLRIRSSNFFGRAISLKISKG